MAKLLARGAFLSFWWAMSMALPRAYTRSVYTPTPERCARDVFI